MPHSPEVGASLAEVIVGQPCTRLEPAASGKKIAESRGKPQNQKRFTNKISNNSQPILASIKVVRYSSR